MAKSLFDVFSVMCTIITGASYVFGLYYLGRRLGIITRIQRLLARIEDDLLQGIIGIVIFLMILPSILTAIFVIGGNQGLRNLLDVIEAVTSYFRQ